MKQYIVTEQDIEKLKDKFFPFEQNEVDEWVQTLEEGKEKFYCECEEKYLDFICPCVGRN